MLLVGWGGVSIPFFLQSHVPLCSVRFVCFKQLPDHNGIQSDSQTYVLECTPRGFFSAFDKLCKSKPISGSRRRNTSPALSVLYLNFFGHVYTSYISMLYIFRLIIDCSILLCYVTLYYCSFLYYVTSCYIISCHATVYYSATHTNSNSSSKTHDSLRMDSYHIYMYIYIYM